MSFFIIVTVEAPRAICATPRNGKPSATSTTMRLYGVMSRLSKEEICQPSLFVANLRKNTSSLILEISQFPAARYPKDIDVAQRVLNEIATSR
jgi:hypothetical protein